MSFFALLSENADIVKSSTITPSSENPTYPATNIKSMPVSQRTRTLAGVTTATWLADRGSAVNVKACAVLNHNLTSGATITLKAGTTSGVSDFTQALTYRAGDIFILLGATQNFRFWRLDLADASNPDTYLSFGRLLLGVHDQLSNFNFSFGWTRQRRTRNIVQRTQLGVPHIEKGFKDRILSFDFEAMTSAQDTTLDTLIDGLDEQGVPALIVPDPAVYDGWLMRNIDPGTVTNRDHKYYERRGVQFQEDPRGITLT